MSCFVSLLCSMQILFMIFIPSISLQSIKKNAKSINSLRTGQYLYKLGKYKQAEFYLIDTIRNKQFSTMLLNQKASLYFMLANVEYLIHPDHVNYAISLLNKVQAFSLDNNNQPNQISIQSKISLSYIYIDQSRFVDARQILQNLLPYLNNVSKISQIYSNKVDIYNAYARLYLDQQNSQKALSSLNQAFTYEKYNNREVQKSLILTNAMFSQTLLTLAGPKTDTSPAIAKILRYAQRSVELSHKYLSPYDFKSNIALITLARAQIFASQYALAQRNLNQARNFLIESLGPNNEQLASVCLNEGALYWYQHQEKKAFSKLSEGISIAQNYPPSKYFKQLLRLEMLYLRSMGLNTDANKIQTILMRLRK